VFWHGNGERFPTSIPASTRWSGGWHGKRHRPARVSALPLPRSAAPVRRHYLRERRGTIYALQQVLGHKSIKTTEGYLEHLTPEEQLAAKHGVAQNPAQSERFGGENG
jgi:integrase/recombinase XerD